MKKLLSVLAATALSCVAYASPVQPEPVETVNETACFETFEQEASLCAEFEGEGTKESPYLISNKEQLLSIASIVSGAAKNTKFYFGLTEDIDLEGAEWTPIGTNTKPFNGAFYGNGHAVKNLKITQERNDNGFFGFIKEADVTNLSIRNFTISYEYTGTTTTYVGLLAGRAQMDSSCKDSQSVFSQISVIGSIDIASKSGSLCAGGLIGTLSSETGNYTVSDCLSLTNITVDSKKSSRTATAGGVLAKLEDNSAKFTLNVHNSYYSGTIDVTSVDEVHCGGIAGHLFSQGNGWTGGWYGQLYADDNTEKNITNCISDGSIKINALGSISVGYVSGFIGSDTTAYKCARISTQTIDATMKGTVYKNYTDSPTTVQQSNLKNYATNTLNFDETIWGFNDVGNSPIHNETVTFTVAYNANGGENAPAAQFKVQNVDIALTKKVPARIGYTFLGWSTSADGEAEYTSGANFTADENTTLHAIWEANTYTVKYNKNGGTGEMSDSAFTYDEKASLSANTFERANHIFMGWDTDESAKTVVYTDSQEVINLTAENGKTLTLYAVWTPTVYYDANGGENAPALQFKHGVEMVVSSEIPSRTGYRFTGWSTSADGEVEYEPGEKYSFDGGITLYAVWEIVESFFNTGAAVNNTDIDLLAELISGKVDASETIWVEKANLHTEETDSSENIEENINIKDLIKLAQLISQQ